MGGFRSKSVPLGSISNERKWPSGQRLEAGDSQEEILQSKNVQLATGTHDFVRY